MYTLSKVKIMYTHLPTTRLKDRTFPILSAPTADLIPPHTP